MLTIRHAYLVAYSMLYSHYWDTRRHEERMKKAFSLPGWLGSMDPYMFEGSMSADPAYWEDWSEIAKKISNSTLLTSAEALQVCISFIEFYAAEFDFDIQWVADEIKTLSPEGDLWTSYIRATVGTE